ncbi:solute carrier family 2, facilitated glucose transporter member 5-like [Gastrophryne carolinensis]
MEACSLVVKCCWSVLRPGHFVAGTPVQHRSLFLMVFVLGIGGTFQYGFQFSVLNSPSPFIKQFINETWIRRYNTSITGGTLTLIWSLVVSVFSIGGLIGSAASGYLAGRFGKKKCTLFNAILPIISAVIVGLTKTSGCFEMIMVGRFLSGFYAGLGLNINAQYVGECAPRKLRGLINTAGPVFVTLGKLSGQIVGLSFTLFVKYYRENCGTKTDNLLLQTCLKNVFFVREIFGTEFLWPQVLLLTGIISFVQLITLPFFPETPIYLLLEKNDKEACQKALKHLWGDRDHQAIIDEMLQEKVDRKKGGSMTVLELIRDPSYRWQLCSIIGMFTGLQLSGGSAIYFYSYDVFKAAGFPEDRIAYVSMGVGSFEFVSAMICSLVVDHLGRKVLMLGGLSLMALVLGLLTVTLSMQNTYFWMPYCSVGLIFTFIFLYGAGPAGAALSTSVEIFPQAPRVPAFVISGVFNWIGIYILGMIFPYVVGSLQQFCFLIFIGIILCAIAFIFFIIPETKGKTIAEITFEYNKLNFRSQQKKEKCLTPEGVLCTRL